MNNLQVYKLPKNNNIDIFTNNNNLVITSPFENNPLFSLGYHYFIERTRSAMSITDNLETKNELYYVVNQYEPNVPNYEDTIINSSKIYLKKEIESRDFYKFWEICFLFDIAERTSLECLIIKDYGEAQAFELYREKFLNKESKKDKINKSYKKGVTADLIIANNIAENENEFVEVLIEEVKNIIECQNKDGNLVLRVFDTFTLPTIKLIYLITSLYNESYIYKPFLSRPSENEKYIICKNFNCKESKKIIANLQEILDSIKGKNFISDVYLDLEVSKEFIDVFKFTNIKLVNQQQIIINEIIKYIKNNNYFGDKYHECRNQQIEATTLWVTNFFPPSNNLYKENKDSLTKLVKTTWEKNNLEKDKFISQLN
jgi:hypothetical protein